MTTRATLEFRRAEAATGMPLSQLNQESHLVPPMPTIKASSHSIVFTGEWWTDSDWILSHNLEGFITENLSYTAMIRSTKPAFVANQSASQYSPSRFHIMYNTSETVTSSAKSDSVFERIRILLQRLADAYSAGTIDIPEIVSLLGNPWTESLVVLMLEVMKAHRPISIGQLSTREEENVLRKLAEIRGTPEAEKFSDSNWIKREVIASQRIESVYVVLDDFPNSE